MSAVSADVLINMLAEQHPPHTHKVLMAYRKLIPLYI